MLDSVSLFDGVAALLDDLKQRCLPWGIVINKTRRYAEPIIRHLGLAPDVIVCGDMVADPKPSPDSLLQATALLKTVPGKCIYVGDDGKDIVAARAAEMPSAAALYGYSAKLDDPELERASWHLTEISQLGCLLAGAWQ